MDCKQVAMEPEKIVAPNPNRKGIIKIVKQDCAEKRPNRTSTYFIPKSKFVATRKPAVVTSYVCKQHSTTCIILDPTDEGICHRWIVKQSVLPVPHDRAMHPQSMAIMQRGYKDALQ